MAMFGESHHRSHEDTRFVGDSQRVHEAEDDFGRAAPTHEGAPDVIKNVVDYTDR